MKRLINSTTFAVFICLLFAIGVFAASQSSSNKRASDIITDVEQVLNEDIASSGTTAFLNDTIVLDWIDAGVREIVSKTKCLQRTVDIPLVTGTSEYAWSALTEAGVSDYAEILACVYFDGVRYRALTKTDIKSLGRADTSKDSPQYWYEWEDSVGIWPTPTAPYNTKIVYAYYVAVPNAVDETTDGIHVPAMLDDALVWYVVSHAKMRDNKPDEAIHYLNLFNELIGLYRGDIFHKPKESVHEATP